MTDEGAARRPGELLRALAVLGEPPGPEQIRIARALGLPGRPSPEGYSDLFLFQLYPYASVHVGPEGMLGGEARDRVAGFWRALGRTPPAEPDHLSALVGLYAALLDEGARTAGATQELFERSRQALLYEHLAPWLFAYLDRVSELASGFYAAWARLLHEALAREVTGRMSAGREPAAAATSTQPVVSAPVPAAARTAAPPTATPAPAATPSAGPAPPRPSDARLPLATAAADLGPLALHLRQAPPLPDPRSGAAGDFLDGLLAPVRCGMTLTRADLARMAGELDLGLRAGERRFALQQLLGQDAAAVLRWLAGEAARQAAGHRGRVSWLGPAAAFLSERAEATVRLLVSLAEEHAGDLAAAVRN